MTKSGMRRFWLASVWTISLVAIGCSKPSPTAPLDPLNDAGPLILPYTGGTTSTVASLAPVSSRGGRQEQIEGRVEGFPAAPAGAFVVDGRTVATTTLTSFVAGNRAGSFADLAIGQRVHVTATATGGDLVA